MYISSKHQEKKSQTAPFLRQVYEISCKPNVQWPNVSEDWLHAGEFEFNPSRDNNYYLHYHFQTASGAHTASMKWTLVGFSTGVKQKVCKVNHSLTSSDKVKMQFNMFSWCDTRAQGLYIDVWIISWLTQHHMTGWYSSPLITLRNLISEAFQPLTSWHTQH